MFPVICRLGPVSIYSYGLMLAIAVVVCAFLLNRDAKRAGIPSDIIFDLIFWVVLSGILGARVFFILLNFHYFVQDPLEIVMINKGGLAWQGGLVFAIAAGLWFFKKKALSLPKMLDLVAPYIALGQAIGRIGCFLNGCCYGKAVAWGIYFPVHNAHLHPTQLYSTVGLLVIFFILKRYQKVSPIPGLVFVAYLFLASLLRFGIEFWRADHYATFMGLSIYQFVCLGIMIAAFYAYSRIKSRAGK
jgi:phosphatidylglycerol---prolipoprotein diacylglyceryl transferase